jgi:surfeit locus 1 family protein
MRFRFTSQALFSRHWWVLLIATAIVAGLTIRLGYWQLGRAQFKESLYSIEQAQAILPPLNTQDFSHLPSISENLQRRIDVQGQWLSQWTIYLENRAFHGKPGFWVFTPLQISPNQVLLVQRGWVARDLVQSDKLPTIETPSGVVRVEGRWVPAPSKMMELSPTDAKPSETYRLNPLRQNIDMAELSQETGLKFVANVLQTGSASEGLIRDWPTSLSGADKNRAYALQWFALALLSIGLFGWFQIYLKLKNAPSTTKL